MADELMSDIRNTAAKYGHDLGDVCILEIVQEVHRAAPASAQLDADLPLLNDEQIEMLWAQHADTAKAGERRIAFGRAVEQEVRAQYAERIRLLTEELATLKAEHATLRAGQSIRGDKTFAALMGEWSGAAHSFDEYTRTLGAKHAWNALIAYIDGRTASTAGQMVRDLVKLWDSGNVSADEYNEAMCAIEDRMRAYAAAPSPLSGTEDAKP